MRTLRKMLLGAGTAVAIVCVVSIVSDSTIPHRNCPECNSRMNMQKIGTYRYNWICTGCDLKMTDLTSHPIPVDDL